MVWPPLPWAKNSLRRSLRYVRHDGRAYHIANTQLRPRYQYQEREIDGGSRQRSRAVPFGPADRPFLYCRLQARCAQWRQRLGGGGNHPAGRRAHLAGCGSAWPCFKFGRQRRVPRLWLFRASMRETENRSPSLAANSQKGEITPDLFEVNSAQAPSAALPVPAFRWRGRTR